MPYTSLGILDITQVARNDVDVDMKNALPGGQPHVNPDIVAIWVEFPINTFFLIINKFHAGRDLVRRQVEKARDMPLRDDQGVAGADGIGIAGAVGKRVRQRHASRVLAKKAGVVGVAFFFRSNF